MNKIDKIKSCKSYKSCLLVLPVLVLLVVISTAQTQSLPLYKNPNLPIETRVNDLVSRMIAARA